MRKCGKCRMEGHINSINNPCLNMIINEQNRDNVIASIPTVTSVTSHLNHNEEVANMKLKHPYTLDQDVGPVHRKIISDDKLSLVFNRNEILLNMDWGMEDGHIYFRVPHRYNNSLNFIREWNDFRDDVTQQNDNRLITVWIYEGRLQGFDSYTKIKGYQKFGTCSCFISVKIESQSYHYIPTGP